MFAEAGLPAYVELRGSTLGEVHELFKVHGACDVNFGYSETPCAPFVDFNSSQWGRCYCSWRPISDLLI